MTIAVIILISINILLVFFLVIRTLSQNLDRTERVFREEISLSRREMAQTLKGFGDSLQQGLERVRDGVERRLESIQKDNNTRLEQMRETVDEKLHSTLEKRLGESFKLVDEQLSKVHKDLGEMRNLASDVGDLKKVMTNVKTRGTWGEVQLENLLEQALTPQQYEKNAAVKRGSAERVEFAVKMPGKDASPVLLPIDAKFPVEDYQRLLEAQDEGDKAAVEEAGRALEARVKSEGRYIRDKYINPPVTTDFALLFLPAEGLYAEVLRRPGLFEMMQRDFRVTIAGPTTILAMLNSLQMGFRTLAVEKRASEVWRVLGAVKTEFARFGGILDKTQKKLQEASRTIDEAASKSRNIERRLGKVQELPSQEAGPLIDEPQELES